MKTATRSSLSGDAVSGFLQPVIRVRGAWLLLTCAGLSLAAPAPEDFPVVRPLTPPAALHSEIGAFVPDDSLWDALDDRCANLRLFDAAGRETPFLIRRRIPTRTLDQLVPFPSPLTIQSLKELDDNRIELRVTRDPRHPRPAALEFESHLRNFEKLVTVSGSRDGEHWTLLADREPIYDYSRYADVRRDRVSLAAGDYTTYRIEVSNITEKKDSPLVEIIRQTRGNGAASEVEATSFRREPFRMNRLTFYEVRQVLTAGTLETATFRAGDMTVTRSDTSRETVIVFTTRRQPVSAIMLLTDDANFSREVTLEGKTEAAPVTWQRITGDRITRIRIGRISEEHLTVVCPDETRYRTYRLRIHDQDNPPLAVTGVEARQNLHEVLFFPKTGQTYRVCAGGEGIALPQYDVATVLARAPAGSADLWHLEAGACAPGPVTGRSWQTYGRKALIGALVLMTAILLVVVVRLARHVDLQ
jgi:hypothetical protein